MKSYDLKLSYSKVLKNTLVSVKKEASLSVGEGTFFKLSEIDEFKKAIKSIYREVKKLSENDIDISIDLWISEYTRNEDGTLKQTKFDAWYYEGPAECDGIHLNPDTRYTPEVHDMWLSYTGNPFEDITA